MFFRIKSRILSLVLFVSLGQILVAQVSFQCVIDSNKMVIGDQRMLEVKVQGQSPMDLDTISFSDWSKLGIEPISQQQWVWENGNSYRQTVRVAAFDTGYIQLPPLSLTFRQGTTQDTVFSNDLAVEVAGITMDSTGLAPIKTIILEPLKFRDFLPYLIGLGIGLLIIGFIFFRKKKPALEPVVIEVPIPADEQALSDLEKLRGKKLWQQGKIKEYQSELTHIIRAYIEDRFEIPALESTTTEILKFSSIKELGKQVNEDLSQILNIADLIKFAKAQPDVDIHERFMTRAEQFIRETREVLPENDENA